VVARSVVLLTVLAFAIPSAALADGGREEFEKANEFFEAGEYDAALPYYQKAYELSGHRPSTIRALAQCERALRMYEEAILHFKEYLSTSPEEGPQIEQTLGLLEELRAKQAEERAKAAAAAPPPAPEPSVAPPPPAITPPPPQEEESGVSPIVWIAIAAAAVGGGVALAFALSGERDPYGGTTDTLLLR
jgi:tetratricopeptide (TPR) repeat protein